MPGALYTLGGGINNADIMTEVWLDSEGDSESSVYNGTKFVTINVPGAESSSAGAISNKNDIVFSWEDASDNYYGALLHAGTFTNFEEPEGSRTCGYGINDHQVIVGSYRPTGSQSDTGFAATY